MPCSYRSLFAEWLSFADMKRQADQGSQSQLDATRDWPEEFFAHGWRGHPWVILEREWCSAWEFERLLRENPDGWGFGMYNYRVLHAPQIDFHAPNDQLLRIVRAIREFPPQRAAYFNEYERPGLENGKWPGTLLDQIAPKPETRLSADNFNSPILLVATDCGTDNYMLLGSVATFDMILREFVARPDLAVDDALAALILYTCHGKPSEMFPGSQSGHRRTFSKSPFTAPLHPARFTEVRAALRARFAYDPSVRIDAELERLLHDHISGVIESLRRKPPRMGIVQSHTPTIHSVARSRLAEAVSDAVLGKSRRRTTTKKEKNDPWWGMVDEQDPRLRQRFLKSLSPAEAEELRNAQKRLPSARNPNTRRALLYRAKAKLRTALRDWLNRSL